MKTGWNIKHVVDQSGRVAIVTGANAGIGYETALQLAGKGMEVIMAARSSTRTEEAISKIKAVFPDAKLKYLHLDLGSMNSVRQFVADFSEHHNHLDLLINNAGVMIPAFDHTSDGFESQMGINYLGHFLLTGLLLPKMRDIRESRIVSLSSIAHRFGTDSFEEKHFRGSLNKSRSYSQSKLACLIFAYELQRRLERNGAYTASMAAHPGVSSTNLGRDMSPVLRFAFPRIGQTADLGALPVLMAALDPKLKGGEYCGPDGIYGWRGQPEVTSSSSISKNKDVASRLWSISEKLTGVSYP